MYELYEWVTTVINMDSSINLPIKFTKDLKYNVILVGLKSDHCDYTKDWKISSDNRTELTLKTLFVKP